MNASPTEALPRVFPTVVHMLADACARFPDATALVCGRTVSVLHRVFAMRGRLCRRIEAAWRARVTRCPRVPKFARYADRHVWRPCGRRAGSPDQSDLYRAGAQLHFRRRRSGRDRLRHRYSPAKSSRCSRRSAYATRCGSAARPAAASMPGGTKPIGNCRSPGPRPDDLATLQYTGGTTGRPKGVNISHRQMAVNISQREAALPTRPGDESILCMMPLFHVFAVAMCLHLAAYCGGRLVIMPRYRPETVLDSSPRRKSRGCRPARRSSLACSIMKNFAATDFSSLRTAYSGSAPLPEETLRRWTAHTGTAILEGFGQTEAGPVLTYVREGGRLKVGSVGPPLPLTDDRDRRHRDREQSAGHRRNRGNSRPRPADHVRLPQQAEGDRRGAARWLALHRRHRRDSTPTDIFLSATARRTW